MARKQSSTKRMARGKMKVTRGGNYPNTVSPVPIATYTIAERGADFDSGSTDSTPVFGTDTSAGPRFTGRRRKLG